MTVEYVTKFTTACPQLVSEWKIPLCDHMIVSQPAFKMNFYKYCLVHCETRTSVSRESNIYSTFKHWSTVNKHLSVDHSECFVIFKYISFTSKDSLNHSFKTG